VFAVSPDGFVKYFEADKEPSLLEIKISKDHYYTSPQDYWIPQIIMQMAVTGYKTLHLCMAYLPVSCFSAKTAEEDESIVTIWLIQFSVAYWEILLKYLCNYVEQVHIARSYLPLQIEKITKMASQLPRLFPADMPRVSCTKVTTIEHAYTSYMGMIMQV